MTGTLAAAAAAILVVAALVANTIRKIPKRERCPDCKEARKTGQAHTCKGNNMTPLEQASIKELFQEIARRLDHVILITSHDATETNEAETLMVHGASMRCYGMLHAATDRVGYCIRNLRDSDDQKWDPRKGE